MKVCKFGGSSLADADAVRRVCEIIKADPDRRIVVVSAPGRRAASDTKVTDLLISAAEQRLQGRSGEKDLAAVEKRYTDIHAGLGLDQSILDEIIRDVRSRLEGDTSHCARFMDRIKAAGEDNCAKLVAAALRASGVAARYVSPADAGLLLSDEHGNARILPESYERLGALAEEECVVVFPGFFGFTKEGVEVTFSRGGSDITGAILAQAVHADVYENFTDVDFVCAADPKIIPNVAPIPELTYREMRELSYAGFHVLHDEAIAPLVQKGIPIAVKNVADPDGPGTRIVREREHTVGQVVGIASSDGFCTIFLSKWLMNREIGFGRRLLQVLEEEGLSYEHVPSGIDNMSVILREADFSEEKELHVIGRMKGELQIDDIEIERGLALIMIVGEGMRYVVGLAAKATKALADAKVNIEMMNQGSSEISMMFGVKASDSERAVRSLYSAFFSDA